MPVLTETVLLPFKDMIVCDGLLSSNISFGGGIRRMLNESYKEAKARHGIVTSLPMSEQPIPVKAPKPRPVPKPPSKEDTAEVLKIILGMIAQFCKEHLNDESGIPHAGGVRATVATGAAAGYNNPDLSGG